MSDDRPAVYVEEGGLIVYRASALDLCPADLLSYRMGEVPNPPTEDQLDRMKEGNLHEPDIIEWLRIKGYNVSHFGSSQLEWDLQVLPGVVIRVHPDGLIWGNGLGERHVLEVKSTSRGNFLRGATYMLEQYRHQFTAEMLAGGEMSSVSGGLKLFLAVKNRDSGRKRTEVIDKLPVAEGDLRELVGRVEIAARLGQELPCTGNKFFCRFPWHQTGGQGETSSKAGGWGKEAKARREVRGAPPPGTGESDESVLVGLASAYASLRDREKAIDDELESVKAAIKEQLGDRSSVKAGSYRVGVRWSEREQVVMSAVPEELMEELRKLDDPRAVTKTRYSTVVVTRLKEPASTATKSSTGTDGNGSTKTDQPSSEATAPPESTTSPTRTGDGEPLASTSLPTAGEA